MADPSDHLSPDHSAATRQRELVTRMVAGDGQALQLLYLEFGPAVHGIVRRILEDPEDAREAVQDTFIKLWRNARSFDPERGNVAAWIVFIARNAAIDRVREGRRRRTVYERLRRESAEPAAPALEFVDAGDDVAQRLGALSPAQRQALELAFFGGFTQAQIATAMRTPIGNVKNHLRRGLQRLRQRANSHE